MRSVERKVKQDLTSLKLFTAVLEIVMSNPYDKTKQYIYISLVLLSKCLRMLEELLKYIDRVCRSAGLSEKRNRANKWAAEGRVTT